MFLEEKKTYKNVTDRRTKYLDLVTVSFSLHYHVQGSVDVSL